MSLSTAPGEPPAAPAPAATAWNRNVLALGFTSLLTDVSSEMLIPVLPLFITLTLKASTSSLGLIEGVAESTASLLRLAAGRLSDRVGRRKPFLVFGYGLSTAAKASFAFAGSWPMVLVMRFSDRVGKGLRNPPRDALLADSVTPAHRGRAFGLHRAMDTLGAAIGPLVAFAMLQAWPGDYRRIFAASAIPGLLSLLVLGWFVTAATHVPAKRQTLARTVSDLGAPFRRFVLVDTVFQLGNSSMAFVLLRAKQGGMREGFVPLAYVLFNVVSALLALPMGTLSDRVGRRALIGPAYVLYAATYALLAWSGAPAMVVAAFALLGVQTAMMEGAQRSLIADFVPGEVRATAYGVYHTAVGLALLPASLAAGWLWQRFGPAYAFGLGAALAAIAALLFVVLLPARRERGERHAASA